MVIQLVLLLLLLLNGYYSLIFILKRVNTYDSIGQFLHPFIFDEINDATIKKRLLFLLLIIVIILYTLSIIEIFLFSL